MTDPLTQAEAALAKMRAGRAPYAINGRADLPAFEAIVAELRERREADKHRTNDEGLLPCPKCQSATGPYLYWWHRGQAWIVICANCKNEEGRERHEYEARRIWNTAAQPPETDDE